ncbi:TonB-dependent receptor [uncultured Tenacibaculum sp.]|uniref:TonB-dependent receptor n=1 Tax=uncultured Tenacibaculum sp. TaxID=174713 RepID=UPI002630DC1D|nr:TonB-dependent receptor [uncultured Tenacibaculum sp.]
MKKLFYLALLFLSLHISAQVTTSKIKGTVTDSAGEPLFGANIVVLHVPSGTVSGAVAQDNGKYTVPNLRVGGPYKITFSFLGFKSKEVENVFLTLGKTTNIDASLSEDGQTLDEVVISASKSKIFNSDRTGAQTSVSATQLKTLPTISRSAADFTRLEPTASNGSFGGRNDQFNNFSLDGSIFNNPFGLDAATPGGQTGAQPVSLDAIEQISVSVAPYDVTLAGFTGASVDAVTKSGTNEFKGTAYGFYRNQDLTGGKISGFDVFKPKLNQVQYGVSIGGPIIKDKLFFFANFEKDDRVDLGSNFQPSSGTTIGVNDSRVTRDDLQLVNNILSQVVIGTDAQGNDVFYNPGAIEGFTFDQESVKGIFKLDWNVNQKHRLAFIYNFLRASKENPAHPTALGFRGPSAATLQFENAGYEINNNIDSFLLELNSNFNEETSNKLQIGYTQFDDFRNPLSTPAPSITILDAAGSSNYIIAGHEPFSINNTLDQKVLQITNNMNFFKGNHTITVGFSFEKFMFDNSFNLGAYGAQGVFFPSGSINDFRNLDAAGEAALVATYQAQFDAAISANNSLTANGVGNPGGWSLAETNVGQLAFYLQDEYEINDDIKLTYGVRFDKPLFFDTKEKIQENIDRKGTYQPGNIYFDPENNQATTLSSLDLPSNDWLISPRLGFNWDVNGENKLQVRGGTGLFTGRLPFVWLGNQVQGVDFFFYQTVDRDFKFPQVWRTNIGLDYKFENGFVVSTDLAYTQDINGAHVQNWGLSNPTGNLVAPGDTRSVYTDADKALNQFGGQTNAYVFTNSDKGRTYNATFKVEKSFENGLYANIAYSYLNSKDVNSIEAEITGDAFAFNPVIGNANNDVLAFSRYGDTHRIIGVASKKFNYAGDKFATTIATFFEYAQGGRFNYTYGGDINNDGSRVNDLLYVPTSAEVTQMQFSGAGQAQAFEEYIQQDDYLSGRRGQYVERYGALAPWRSRWDVKLLQDFNFNVSENKQNTIQLSVDILNVGNLINSAWGVVQQPVNVQPLGVVVDQNTGVPTYTFDGNLVETFTFDTSLNSRWQMQLGLRYIF